MEYSKGNWVRKIGKFFEVMIAVDDDKLDSSGYKHDSTLICDEIYSEKEGDISLVIHSPRMYELLKDLVSANERKGSLDHVGIERVVKLIKNIESDGYRRK